MNQPWQTAYCSICNNQLPNPLNGPVCGICRANANGISARTSKVYGGICSSCGCKGFGDPCPRCRADLKAVMVEFRDEVDAAMIEDARRSSGVCHCGDCACTETKATDKEYFNTKDRLTKANRQVIDLKKALDELGEWCDDGIERMSAGIEKAHSDTKRALILHTKKAMYEEVCEHLIATLESNEIDVFSK